MDEDKRTGRRFARKIEDFTCERCGEEIKGNGYTDHCPFCLVSKHVDIMTGDRSAKCWGLMYVERALYAHDGYIIYYKCEKCGAHKKVGAAASDNIEALSELIAC